MRQGTARAARLAAALLACACACASGPAPARSCRDEVGVRRAGDLARDCRDVTSLTRALCHAGNPCSVLIEEIRRGCRELGPESPNVCGAYVEDDDDPDSE